MKQHRILILAAVIVLIAVISLCGVQLYLSPLPLKIIDQDGSGVLSLSEILSARDVGTRKVAGKSWCTEYFWYKDGLRAYESCAGNKP